MPAPALSSPNSTHFQLNHPRAHLTLSLYTHLGLHGHFRSLLVRLCLYLSRSLSSQQFQVYCLLFPTRHYGFPSSLALLLRRPHKRSRIKIESYQPAVDGAVPSKAHLDLHFEFLLPTGSHEWPSLPRIRQALRPPWNLSSPAMPVEGGRSSAPRPSLVTDVSVQA